MVSGLLHVVGRMASLHPLHYLSGALPHTHVLVLKKAGSSLSQGQAPVLMWLTALRVLRRDVPIATVGGWVGSTQSLWSLRCGESTL